MNRSELIEGLKKGTQLQDFVFIEKEDGVCWERSTNQKKDSIFIGFSGYPGEYSLQNPLATVSFDSVEMFMRNLEIPKPFLFSQYTCKFLQPKLLDKYFFHKIKITDQTSFQKIIDHLNNILKEVLEFFNQTCTTEDLLSKLNKMELNIASEFLGQPFVLRKMILLKINDLQAYSNFSKKVIENFEEKKSPLLNVVLELIERLNSIHSSQ